MNDRLSEERLNDYVDGLLGERDTREVERLLAGEPEARATVDFLRSLRARAQQLPASVEPDRDLWADIAARMAPAPLVSVGDEAPMSRARASAWWPSLQGSQWATLAAAAMVLVVTSSALTVWMIGTTGGPAVSPGPGGDEQAAPVADGARPEAEYALEIEQLMRVLYENRDTLDPDTVSTIETNLRVIDRAIDRVREALEGDPANTGLSRMLIQNYRHKLELLQRANRFIELS